LLAWKTDKTLKDSGSLIPREFKQDFHVAKLVEQTEKWTWVQESKPDKPNSVIISTQT